MINNKIGIGGAAALLTLSRLFTEVSALPDENTGYGMQRFTVIILSFLLTAAVYLPLIAVINRTDGESPIAVIARKSKLLSGFVGVSVSVYLLFNAAETGLRAHYYASSTVFDSAPSLYFYFFTGAALLFAVYKGIESVSRAGTVVNGILILLLVLITAALFSHIRIDRLYPAFIDDADRLFVDVIREFSQGGEYLVFAVICGNVGGKSHRNTTAVPFYLGTSLAGLLLMTFLYDTVFGRLVSRLDFPFYTLSSISDITLLHRINGIDVTVWVMAGILRLALYSLAFGSIVRTCFGLDKAVMPASFVFGALALGLSELFTAFPDIYEPLRRISDSGIPLAAAAVFIPSAAFGCTIKRKAARQ